MARMAVSGQMSIARDSMRGLGRLSFTILVGCLAARSAPFVAAAGFPVGSVFAVEEKDREGSVEGRVILTPPVQKPRPLPVFKSRDFCGVTVANETLLVSADGSLQNAAVLLRPLEAKAVTRPGFLTLDNRNCRFTPHVQVATIGSELLLTNSDPILHTVHARLGTETLFNVGLPTWRVVSKRLDRGGVIKIDCDVLHTWMSAAIVVADTPYFALTDDAGRFKIERLPVGDYEMEVWHERLGVRRLRVSVARSAATSVEVIYSAAKIR